MKGFYIKAAVVLDEPMDVEDLTFEFFECGHKFGDNNYTVRSEAGEWKFAHWHPVAGCWYVDDIDCSGGGKTAAEYEEGLANEVGC